MFVNFLIQLGKRIFYFLLSKRTSDVEDAHFFHKLISTDQNDFVFVYIIQYCTFKVKKPTHQYANLTCVLVATVKHNCPHICSFNLLPALSHVYSWCMCLCAQGCSVNCFHLTSSGVSHLPPPQPSHTHIGGNQAVGLFCIVLEAFMHILTWPRS